MGETIMSNILSPKEIKQLNKLGTDIRMSLDLNYTDLNDIGIPCRTDRFQAIKSMISYLKIHGYKVTEGGSDEKDCSK